MKGLATLIKLHKRTLDELRRRMVTLENQKGELEQMSRVLAEELKSEMELATKTAEMRSFFGDFAKRMKVRQDEIFEEISALDKQIERLLIEISEAFSELKKYEIALANAKLRAQEELNRKETVAMDEIASQQFMRKTEDH